ncbi:MAG: phage holin family protein [Candidatus Levybacteria bacterium]|nr:phage holin family protein [Candidatus Levybacteria bacterium]
MKGILRNVLLYAFSLYLTQMLFSGLVLHNGIRTLIVGGILLAIGFKIIKPVLSIISLPFNMLTLGLFSIVILAFILFLITLIYPSIEVRPFTFTGFSFWGIEIHRFYVSLLLSYALISGTIYLITKFINWLFGK